MRILTISDLHVDYKENFDWVDQLSNEDFQQDLLIVAGDISEDLGLIQKTLETLKSKFNTVAFVPGNHDLWVTKNDFESSFIKFESILTKIKSLDIQTSSFKFSNYEIHPIFSWYDYSFGQPSEDLKTQWTDFRRCNWNESGISQVKIADFFFNKNTLNEPESTSQIISFSHFVPRKDLFPFFLPPIIKFLLPCMGSIKIENILRSLNSKYHIYGHSHLNVLKKKQGTMYINNAFGYPRETHICKKKLFNVIDNYHL